MHDHKMAFIEPLDISLFTCLANVFLCAIIAQNIYY